jgi:hypothetical protein
MVVADSNWFGMQHLESLVHQVASTFGNAVFFDNMMNGEQDIFFLIFDQCQQ